MAGQFPDWMRRKVIYTADLPRTRELLKDLSVHTVCQGARCPNLSECFSRRTATFMILGDTCTRGCRFCAVTKGTPAAVDEAEPARVAEAACRLGLKHVVITSVTRDDLPDGGANQFVRTMQAIRQRLPGATVEVLTPDFGGNRAAIRQVAEAAPEVYNHNVETVPRLYPTVRPQAHYQRSLQLLQLVKEQDPGILTKSGLMVGLGETREEVLGVMEDLRKVACDLLTIGQYLRPSHRHLAVQEYVTPETYAYYRRMGQSMGFQQVAAGPYVRSSYQADQLIK
ncbi:lipoyl synthase [Desulforamulus hydrothermalis]|uniref:Lipoyl synthase n=1 Tax=Desulforamulus hydrothermalis Lam5 = DSM 18033 TaxID=1121428 RepID=K8E918_9FIRM|nr:lipoyl synthase [Desulforamulus hydrothermalis]CCO08018.1 Lipoyl synthase [Desulforamulus hydrothermalis Lam5 = DSM 18033]SHG84042.1 lipoic acid synthetase [Desulforamulus hydrothermalis Lam5 = DSM 18033]